ncbi:DUF3253 domain-containing protein [Cribrihabitans sp. XS_ASV171]
MPIRASAGAVTTPSDKAIAQAICDLAHRRGVGKTFCPSEVARSLSEEWRPLMSRVRMVAAALAVEGRIEVTQTGQAVDPETALGAIRLGLPRRDCA